jgi:hypothetical protein
MGFWDFLKPIERKVKKNKVVIALKAKISELRGIGEEAFYEFERISKDELLQQISKSEVIGMIGDNQVAGKLLEKLLKILSD